VATIFRDGYLQQGEFETGGHVHINDSLVHI